MNFPPFFNISLCLSKCNESFKVWRDTNGGPLLIICHRAAWGEISASGHDGMLQLNVLIQCQKATNLYT